MGATRGSYGAAERWVAKGLDSFPGVRRIAKAVYQRLNYLLTRKRNFRCAVHPAAELLTPMRWAGAPECGGEWFFGYYDKSPWSPDMERMLFHRPLGQRAELLLVDRAARTTRALATTHAWNAQQGSQMQWLPGSDGRLVIFNDLLRQDLGCRVVALDGKDQAFIPWPIQTVNPCRPEALALNYRRLHQMRPEYGYAVDARNFSPDQPLKRDGVWRVALDAGTGELVLSLAALADHAPRREMDGATHKVNHLIYSPAGTRFVFMHRWMGSQGKFSRLYVARPDGADLRLLMDARMVAHYHWRDEHHVLVWGRTAEEGDHYYLVNVNTGDHEVMGAGVLDAQGDGHPSFSPDRSWVVTDTYPDRARLRHLLIFNTRSGELIEVGRFFAPWAFDGPVRCDLHPRWSPDGRWISVDSSHEGLRRSYLIRVDAVRGTLQD